MFYFNYSNGILVGDQIALRVFETVRASQGPSANPSFERRDLSGTFTVETNGDLSIPGIGRLNADRLSQLVGDAESHTTLALQNPGNRPGSGTNPRCSRETMRIALSSPKAKSIIPSQAMSTPPQSP